MYMEFCPATFNYATTNNYLSSVASRVELANDHSMCPCPTGVRGLNTHPRVPGDGDECPQFEAGVDKQGQPQQEQHGRRAKPDTPLVLQH